MLPAISLEAWRAQGLAFAHKGQAIFYRDSGGDAGKPVLLLIHGFPTASWDWQAVWEDLSQHFRLIAPDMLGFGFSAKPADHHYSIHGQADLHATLCAELGIARAHVLAHDYGVSVAQELLARHEQWQQSLTLQSIVFLNGGLFPEVHRPRFIQKLLASPLGLVVSLLNHEKSFSRSLAAVFGPNTQPSAEELHQFWQLIAENKGHRIMHRLIRYLADRREHRSRWLAAMQATSVPMRLGFRSHRLDCYLSVQT